MRFLSCVFVAYLMILGGCSTSTAAEAIAVSGQALEGNQVLGFEDVSGWAASTATLALSNTHVEGSHALAVSQAGSATVHIRSVPLSTPVGDQLSFQLLVPTQQPNPFWLGAVELYLDVPSRNVNSAFIGHQELTGLTVGQFQRITFTVPAWVASALRAGPYNDLSFEFALTVPAGSQTYLFDALTSDGTVRIDQFDVFSGGGAVPDPDLSVSPALVGTISQGFATFYSKAGVLDHQFVLQGTGRPVGDSKIVYDTSSGLWFLSHIVDLGSGNFGVEFFVSTDATGTTYRPSLPITADTLLDNPNITVSSDKVVVASGHCLWTVAKQALINGSAPPVPSTVCNIQNGDQVYGVQYGAVVPSTAYMIAVSDDTHINWISVDGTPEQGNVLVTQHIVPVPPLAASPSIIQQGGTRLENGGSLAMWNADHLWWSRTEGCGSVTCPRMFDVQTATNSVDSFDFSMPGTFLWSAIAGIDSIGNMWALMSEVSPTTSPGLALGGRSAGGQIQQPTTIVSGISPFPIDRWGDYFGSAQDPVDGTVWLIGEYSVANGQYSNRVVHVLGQ
jgi:hypothetical protein